ncbi:hypothetical protein CI238_13185, partial [Colletotrichum incanum]
MDGFQLVSRHWPVSQSSSVVPNVCPRCGIPPTLVSCGCKVSLVRHDEPGGWGPSIIHLMRQSQPQPQSQAWLRFRGQRQSINATVL